MSDVTVAIFYVAFVVMYIAANSAFLARPTISSIGSSVVSPFKESPWSMPGEPTKTFTNITRVDELYDWLTRTVSVALFREQSDYNGYWAGGDPIPIVGNSTRWPATIGGFNRVLVMRLAAKRWKTAPNAKGRFTEGYPTLLKGGTALLSDSTQSSYEETGDVQGHDRTYSWQVSGSPGRAGAYTVYFNPMNGSQAFDTLLQSMLDNNQFDRQLAHFWLDFITYNGNNDMFLHVEFKFSFDFAGVCVHTTRIKGFNLRIFDASIPEYRNIRDLNIVIFIFNIGFYIMELRKILEVGIVQHFKRFNASIDMLSLVLCTIYNCMCWSIATFPIFNDFEFTDLLQGDSRAQVNSFEKMLNAASTLDSQSWLIAVNLLLMCIRGSMLFASLYWKLGLMFKILETTLFSILYFCSMFILVLMGFVFYGMFTFGSKYEGMASVLDSLYTCFAMLTGLSILPDLMEADPLMAYIYFYAFYVFFYLIMRNVFTSILLSGYDATMQAREDRGGSDDRNKNPLKELWMDILTFKEMVLKAIGKCMGFFKDYVEPFKRVLLVFYQSLPCFRGIGQMVEFVRDKMRKAMHAAGGSKRAEKKNATQAQPSAQEGKGLKADAADFGRMIFFMSNFLCFIILQTRGQESYFASQATMNSWLPSDYFDEIRTFEDVRRWADDAVVNQMYLAERLWCASTSDRNPHSEDARICSGDGIEQQVTKLRNWNFGFMNTTFVRLTVIPACFVENPNPTWSQGMPLIRKTPSGNCVSADCVSIKSDYSCHTKNGISWSVLEDENAQPLYNWSNVGRLGAFDLRGGLVFNFGTAYEDARRTMDKVKDANTDIGSWFSMQNSAAMIFQWVTYNGNLDMFTYNVAGFSLDDTGHMHKVRQAFSLPLNLQDGGGQFGILRIVIMVNFCMYVVLVIVNIITLIREWIKLRSKADSTLDFLIGFFSDVWNFTDVISLVINVISIVNFTSYFLMPFRRDYEFSLDPNNRYHVPDADVKAFNMAKSVDPERPVEDDWYILHMFERANSSYNTFLRFAALNSFFIAIKVVKYVSKIPQIKPFYKTIASGLSQNIFFMIIIFLLLFGFSVFLNVVLGSVVMEVNTPFSAFLTLYYWMLGIFNMKPYLEADRVFSIFFFIIVMLIFYFIATNMFLATMLNTFSDMVGKDAIEKEEAGLRKKKKVRMVEYNKAEGMNIEEDIKAKVILDANNEPLRVEVEEVVKPQGDKEPAGEKGSTSAEKESTEDGAPAARAGAVAAGVEKGDIITRVNKDSKDFKKYLMLYQQPQEDEEAEKTPSVPAVLSRLNDKYKNGTMTVFFKRADGGAFAAAFGQEDDDTTVKPTVKNFWKAKGAIVRTEDEVRSQTRQEENINTQDDAEDSEGEDANKDAPDKDKENLKRMVREKVKTRLEDLLFKRRGEEQDGAAAARGTEDDDDDDKDYEELDVLVLADKLERMLPDGTELWLDTLMTAVERECEGGDESLFTDLLRTSDMQELQGRSHKDIKNDGEPPALTTFHKNMNDILSILDYKAKFKYYEALEFESSNFQRTYEQQNVVLHEYVCELEDEFKKIMEKIHTDRAKRNIMLKKLAGLLGKEQEAAAVTNQDGQRKPHMARLTTPWPRSKIPQAANTGRGR